MTYSHTRAYGPHEHHRFFPYDRWPLAVRIYIRTENL